MVKWEVKLVIVVIQYKFVCQPVWENINKAVKAGGPGAEGNRVSHRSSDSRLKEKAPSSV